MITTAKRLGALLSACLLLWSASISALADEAGMPESEAPPEETQQEDAALSDGISTWKIRKLPSTPRQISRPVSPKCIFTP